MRRTNVCLVRHFRRITLASLAFWFIPCLPVGAADSDAVVVEKINKAIRQGWIDNEIKPSERASDEEFARRVSLDIVGHTPSYGALMEFLEDESPDKRQKLVDRLLDDEGYIRSWSSLWANKLVGRGNNRGGRGQLARWLRNALYRNIPYNQFVYQLIAAEGDSRENGAVNFLASHLNQGAIPATAITSRIFLGLQVQCTQCHNHPFNDWKQAQFWSMNAFFRGTSRQRGQERGQFSLVDRPSTELVFFEKRSGLQLATRRIFVDGTPVKIDDETKPRIQLAELVSDPTKPYMAQSQVNRMWSHFFGFGFTKPIDDMGPHNPPSHPELLKYLGDEFRGASFDVKRLIRWICATEAYNLTSRFGEGNTDDAPTTGTTPLFSHMYLKLFRAEQLYDSLIVATQAHKSNRSFEAAETQRRAWLGQFISTFGTDENDESTTFNGTIPQALVLMNGQMMASALGGGKGSFLQRVLASPDGDIREKKSTTKSSRRKTTKRKPRPLTPRQKAQLAKAQARAIPKKIETIFLVALSRKPTESELEKFDAVFQEREKRDPIEGLQDVFWALLNSNEFITNH